MLIGSFLIENSVDLSKNFFSADSAYLQVSFPGSLDHQFDAEIIFKNCLLNPVLTTLSQFSQTKEMLNSESGTGKSYGID